MSLFQVCAMLAMLSERTSLLSLVSCFCCCRVIVAVAVVVLPFLMKFIFSVPRILVIRTNYVHCSSIPWVVFFFLFA